MIYKRYTDQFDTIASHEKIAEQISRAMKKLLDDTGGIVYGGNYSLKFIMDGCTTQGIVTLDFIKDHTTLNYWDGEKTRTEQVFYKDFEKFEHLPSACQSEEVQREFIEYKKGVHDCSGDNV